MGFFSKLFEKKICSVCGGEIGLLGNRKLEDGNLCKHCAAKLSPWFDERRHSTVDQIQQQLRYREENQQRLVNFRPVKTYGENYKLKVQFENDVPTFFVVAQSSDHLEENADLLAFNQVTSFEIDIREDKDEIKRRNDAGEMVSYNPKRYTYSYDFYAELHTDNPYCDDICFRLNQSTLDLETVERTGIYIKDFDPNTYPEYREYKFLCDELEALFLAGMQGLPFHPLQQAVPVAPVAPAPVRVAPAVPTMADVVPVGAPAGLPVMMPPQPAPPAVPVAKQGWKCFCGAENTGKFCSECGTARFDPDQIECSECSWTIEEPGQVPKFCPNCGKAFNADDIQ